MKSNLIKYLFFIVVIVLIIVSIYILYIDKNPKTFASEENIKKIEKSNEINIGTVGNIGINPILSNNRDVQYFLKLVYLPLVDITQDFKTENKLAKEFSKINSKTYIVKLKEDVLWHDGKKFNAQDVIFTVEALKQENIKSIYKENVKNIEKIEQIDDYTLKIFLTEEVPFFEYKMCFPILCSSTYDKDTLNSTTVIPNGTGDYKIKEIKKDIIKISLANKENGSKTISLIIKESEKELFNAFLKGEIDFFTTENLDYENYLGTMGYNAIKIENRELDYLVVNNEDVGIRKAINYGINKNNINYEVFNNKNNICDFPLYYGSYLYLNEHENVYNLNNAKNSLIESRLEI